MLITNCYTDNGQKQSSNYQHHKLTFSTVHTFNFIHSIYQRAFASSLASRKAVPKTGLYSLWPSDVASKETSEASSPYQQKKCNSDCPIAFPGGDAVELPQLYIIYLKYLLHLCIHDLEQIWSPLRLLLVSVPLKNI